MDIIIDGLTVETRGIASFCGYELSATVIDIDLIEECLTFVRFVSDYIKEGATIRPDETLKYGYWLTKLVLENQKKMVFWEHNPEATEFIFGVNHTLSYWHGQHQMCAKVGATFMPPLPDQLIVISEGVYEGDDVEGVRYPSPEHMSGWWLTTDRYNGDVNSLKKVHVHHVSAKRPDLANFFALPFGYRFFSPTRDIWLDRKINQTNS